MPHTITLKDGSNHTLFSDRDLAYVVENRLGYEAGAIVERLANAASAAEIYAAEKINTDLASYEGSLESNTVCFQEILETVAKLELLLSAPRTNKGEALSLCANIRKEIGNQI